MNIYWVILNAYTLNINKHWLTRMTHRILHWPFWNCNSYSISRRMHRIARRTSFCNSDKVVSLIATPYSLEHNIFRRSDWDETVMLPFENTEIPVPKGYDGVLRVSFGDYMVFPPKEKRGVWHHFSIDPNTPYKDIIAANSSD